MGVFADWQPQYAERGIATFPVHGKRPAVARYLQMGLPASRNLALRFGDADGIGFACGRRSRITVVDVDSTDEAQLRAVLERFGHTPLLVRSGSGHHQAWYRHNGEKRAIRPDKSVPVDVLGGGFVVAPPSFGARRPYEIISGSLDDLATLPRIHSHQTCGAPPSELSSRRCIRLGERNNELWRMCMTHAPKCRGFGDLLEFGMKANREHLHEPLSDGEIIKVVQSAWMKEERGENFFGSRKGLVISNEQVDAILLAFPDAFILLTMLKRRHWARVFVCANEMRHIMPRGGWTRQRFAAARAKLEELGEIELVRPAGRRCPAEYKLKGVEI